MALAGWRDTYESLSQLQSPTGEEFEQLATSAYMLGDEDEWRAVLERAAGRWAESGRGLRAARCAFWIGTSLALRGEMGPAGGWLGRAQRLVDAEGRECVEQGYLLLPVAFQHDASGDAEGAISTAASAAEVGARFGDADLLALALDLEGELLLRDGRVREGLALLDEAMVSVTAGELSPIATGIVYCGVILACEGVFELRRAREWTAALTRWCDEQADLTAFTGRCLAHRANVLRLQGDWQDALEAAAGASRRSDQAQNQAAMAKACYLQAEVRRLRGEFSAAEELYRESSRLGLEPQPGLALLRLAQGRRDAALSAIRRATNEAAEVPQRAGLLPAFAEIALAAGDVSDAQAACDELEPIAELCDSDLLRAMLRHARGATALAASDPQAALADLRGAAGIWQELEAPYELARTRVLIGLACRSLGDEDSCALELDAARRVFTELGAKPDLAALESSTGSRSSHGLSRRELEVLRLVAAGRTNRQIATTLVISEHTVARHVQNIFTKLGVASRTAAGAFAFEHDLA